MVVPSHNANKAIRSVLPKLSSRNTLPSLPSEAILAKTQVPLLVKELPR